MENMIIQHKVNTHININTKLEITKDENKRNHKQIPLNNNCTNTINTESNINNLKKLQIQNKP